MRLFSGSASARLGPVAPSRWLVRELKELAHDRVDDEDETRGVHTAYEHQGDMAHNTPTFAKKSERLPKIGWRAQRVEEIIARSECNRRQDTEPQQVCRAGPNLAPRVEVRADRMRLITDVLHEWCGTDEDEVPRQEDEENVQHIEELRVVRHIPPALIGSRQRW